MIFLAKKGDFTPLKALWIRELEGVGTEFTLVQN
jgi:hypothetical protein